MMENRQTKTRGEADSVRPVESAYSVLLRFLKTTTHLGGPPHEWLRELETILMVCDVVREHARLVNEHPDGISNAPVVAIPLCICVCLLLLPLARKGLREYFQL